MFPGSSFIETSKTRSRSSHRGGWNLVEQYRLERDFFDRSDGFVNSASATSMKIPRSAKMIMPWYKFVFHTLYTHNRRSSPVARTSASAAPPKAAPKTASALTDRDESSFDATVSRGELLQDFTQIPATAFRRGLNPSS